MLFHYIVHLFCQIKPLERNVLAPLLKVMNREKLVFENLLMRVVVYEVHKLDGDIMLIVGNCSPTQQIQHSFQIG